MDIHFNAFISYRHHPDDIKVAMEVHRALERYKIPKSLKKKLNVRGPMRLFRDKEELPITSNLNDDIGDALRNSDFLIVICSVHTKESIWVQREIELFLKSHDRHRVLTVLASGEPYDVIPEILLYDDRVDPITGETIRELVEPLSCDWRVGKRKAKHEELPRLAAPLLGCAYDELRQRQKQYRTRRLITLVSLAMAAILGFSVYVLRNSMIIQQKNVEIQANLDESLRNQSRHLATAAQERLDAGDRFMAIALAKAALPSETNDRPYVADAELALSNALGVYQENLRTIAVGAVSPGSQAVITQFWVDADGKTIYIKDMRKHVTVWDASSLEKLGSWDHSKDLLEKLVPANDGLALVRCSTDNGHELRCVQADGTVLWKQENCVDLTIAEDADVALVITEQDQGGYKLLYLDLQSGKQLKKPVALDMFDDTVKPRQFYSCDVMEGMPVIISAYPDKKVVMFDWETGESMELPAELSSYAIATVTSDRKLVAISYGEADVFAGVFEDNRVNSTLRMQVTCCDLTDGTLLWQTEMTSSVSGKASVNEIPGGGRVLCQNGPVFQVLDLESGETLNRCQAGSSAVAVVMGEKYAQAILEDGYICNYWYDENYCYEDKSLQSGVYDAYICNGYFSLQRYGNQVTIYQRVAPPTLWDHDYTYAIFISDQYVHGDQWLIRSSADLYLFDLNTHEIRWAAETPVNLLLGFHDDGTQIRFLDRNGYLYVLDSTTCELVSTPEAITEETYERGYFQDEVLYYITSGYTEDWEYFMRVNVKSLDSGECTSYELPAQIAENEYYRYTPIVRNGQYLWLWESKLGQLLQLDLSSGALEVLVEDMETCPAFAVNDDGTRVAFTNLDHVLVWGEEMQTIAMEEDVLVGSLYFYGEELLALCDNGYLYRYDAFGNLLSSTELDVSDSFSSNLLKVEEVTQADINWQQTADGKLVVSTFAQGNVIDCENWRVSASVPGYYFYRDADNTFVCNGDSGICAYPAYSLEQLLQLAQEELGDYSLTDQQKLAYGIQ